MNMNLRANASVKTLYEVRRTRTTVLVVLSTGFGGGGTEMVSTVSNWQQ